MKQVAQRTNRVRTSAPPTETARRAFSIFRARRAAIRAEQPKNRRSLAPRATSTPPRAPLRAHLAVLRERVRLFLARIERPARLLGRVAMVIAVAAGAIAAGRLAERHVRSSSAFAIREIEIVGLGRLDRETVIAASGLAIGQNVFETTIEDARSRLVAHPWIAEADVERRLPGSFSIRIREHQPVAQLALAHRYLVSEDGTVFKRSEASDPVDLPVVTGVDSARFTSDLPYRAQTMLEVVALLHEYGGVGLLRREPLSEVHVEPDGALSLYVGDDPVYVRLGRGPFRTKLRKLRQVFDRLERGETRPAYVYLDNDRRPDRATVRLR